MKPSLLLFDIDGTLLHTGGAGLSAFTAACEAVLRRPVRFTKKDFAGKVDILIFKGLFESHPPAGEDFNKAWERFRLLYPRFLEERAKELSGWRVYPGVREFLEKNRDCHCFALLTGNIRRGAEIKLKAVDLWKYFPCGGFGDDGASREQVAQAALKKAGAHFNNAFNDVWVVGDTIHDVRCGKHIGARTLGVRTGFSEPGELEAAGADRVVSSLSEFSVTGN